MALLKQSLESVSQRKLYIVKSTGLPFLFPRLAATKTEIDLDIGCTNQ